VDEKIPIFVQKCGYFIPSTKNNSAQNMVNTCIFIPPFIFSLHPPNSQQCRGDTCKKLKKIEKIKFEISNEFLKFQMNH